MAIAAEQEHFNLRPHRLRSNPYLGWTYRYGSLAYAMRRMAGSWRREVRIGPCGSGTRKEKKRAES